MASRLYRFDDGAGAVSVSRYFLPMAMTFLYNCNHFLGRELDVVGQISLREHTSAGAELHPVSSVFQNLANLFLHCRDAVGHAFVSIVKLGSEVGVVAMAAGAADHGSRDLHARAGDISGIDSVAQRNIGVVGRPHIADSGKAYVERHPRPFSTDDRHARCRQSMKGNAVKLGLVVEVGVQVDQTGQ